MGGRLSGAVKRLRWTNELAAVQRIPPMHTDRPAVISVLSIDGRMLTSETAALVGRLLQTVSELPVAMIDADGVNLPLRGPLGAHGSSDMVGLSREKHRVLTRVNIETFADTTGTVPLLSIWEGGPGLVAPKVLRTSLERLQHRCPTVVVNLPGTCPPETIAAAVARSTHVLLVADRYHQGHGWLYQQGHQLSALARTEAVTVVAVGAEGEDLPADTVALPAPVSSRDSRTRILVPTDPESLTMYHRLAGRVYG